MYVPPAFRPDEDALREFVLAAEFGLLVSNDTPAPRATHLPLVAREAGNGLIVDCHLARANPHWRDLDGAGVLLVVQGPGAYVSPAWYAERDVPTWNYQSAHLRGTVSLLTGEDFRKHLITLVRRHEGRRRNPVNPADWPEGFIEQQMRGAVGLSIRIEALEGAFKLSQNKPAADRQRIATGLSEEGGPDGAALAEAMRRES